MNSNKKLFFVGILILSVITISTAQEVSWNRTFKGDYEVTMGITPDSGYILSASIGSDGALLVKTDANGSMLWNKTFGGALMEFGQGAQSTSDHGYITIADKYYQAGYPASTEIWLIKTDANGNEVWNRTYGVNQSETAHGILQTADGGFVFLGESGFDNIWLVKTDANGSMMWNTTFSGTSIEANSLRQTSDGGFIITGGTGTDADIWLIKTNSEGTHLWNKTFGGTSGDSGKSVKQTSDGGFIILGNTWSYGPGVLNAWLIKTDASGIVEWNQTYGTADRVTIGNDVQQTQSGGYAITGYIGTRGVFLDDLMIIKTDARGNMLWNKTIGGPYEDVGYAIEELPNKDYIVAGITNSGEPFTDTTRIWLLSIKPPEECTLIGDTPSCGEITIPEVINTINLWIQGHCTLTDVIELINAWALPA